MVTVVLLSLLWSALECFDVGLASSIRKLVSVSGVPDQSSEVACVQRSDTDIDSPYHICFLVLRRRGTQLTRRLAKRQVLELEARVASAAKAKYLLCSWRSPWDHGSDSPLLTGAVFEFALHGLLAGPLEGDQIVVHVGFGRLHFIFHGRALHSCSRNALWLGAETCRSSFHPLRSVYAAVTVAILDDFGSIPGVATARGIWVEIHLGLDIMTDTGLRMHLDDASGQGMFLLTLHSSMQSWAVTHAKHPQMRDMGSFIGPSESHPRSIALPLNVGEWTSTDFPTVTLAWVLDVLLAGRAVEQLHIRTGRDNLQDAVTAVLSGGPSLYRVASICVYGLADTNRFLKLLDSYVWPTAPFEQHHYSTGACFQVKENSIRSYPLKMTNALIRMDSANSIGLHMSASLPVSGLDSRGTLGIPNDKQLWIEVGCNNWEMLHDELHRHRDVFLLTFEPLVDKFAYLEALSERVDRHLVLPFAISPAYMGNFASIRSQNYTNFRGASGRQFQESGASSLLHYAAGYEDHLWSGASSQYASFREYLVPTVPLEWIMKNVVGNREISFLKIDAQGLDFQVFVSLGHYTQFVKKVQMELHTHVRHAGEIPCAEVIKAMHLVHGFRVQQGLCTSFDPQWHDEVDIIFERI